MIETIFFSVFCYDGCNLLSSKSIIWIEEEEYPEVDRMTDYSGTYVMVQFIEYDRETGTIVVNMIQEAAAPETAIKKG